MHDAKPQPDQSKQPGGRDARGRFARGNRHGKGRPPAQPAIEYLRTAKATVSPDDLAAVLTKVTSCAKAGDMQAARLVVQTFMPTEGGREALEQMLQPQSQPYEYRVAGQPRSEALREMMIELLRTCQRLQEHESLESATHTALPPVTQPGDQSYANRNKTPWQ